MNKIIPFRQPRKAYDRACYWLSLLDRGASEQDLERFGEWLAEDPENAAALAKVASLWDRMSSLSELSRIFPLESYEMANGPSLVRRNVIAAGAFAVGVLAAGGAGLLMMDGAQGEWTYRTAVGEQSAVNLDDGSEVVLNTNTLIHVSYSRGERKVHLAQGEALFTVAPDTSRPFRVYAGNRVVEAVGTAFTVHRDPYEAVEVMVTEGNVKLLKLTETRTRSAPAARSADSGLAAQPISLRAGDVAAVSGGNDDQVRTRQIEQEEMRARLAWREGMLLFQGDTLQHVVDEVSRYTLVRIEADPSVSDIVVRGYFRAGDIDGLLVTMRQNFQIGAQVLSDDHIILVRNQRDDSGQGN